MSEASSLELLLEEYGKLIWHIIHSNLRQRKVPVDHAQDIYQEVCIRLMSEMDNYDESMGSKKAFISSIAKTTSMRYSRNYFRSTPIELDEDRAGYLYNDERIIREFVDHYPTTKTNRRIIYRAIEGYKQHELAKEFNMSQSTISRILGEFKDYLIDELK